MGSLGDAWVNIMQTRVENIMDLWVENILRVIFGERNEGFCGDYHGDLDGGMGGPMV